MIRYASPTFSSDSAALATGGFDGVVRLYDAANGALKKAFVPGKPTMIRYASPTFSSYSARLATGGFDGVVRLYDAATGASKKAFARGGLR